MCGAKVAQAAVAFATSGVVATGTTLLAVPHPAAIVAGDLLVMVVGNKYPTNGPATPAGWTLLANGQQSGGSGASGPDRGQVYSTVFVKQALGGESGNLAVTISSANTSMARMFRYTKAAGASWDYAAANGSDDTADTVWSVTGAANPGITSGDMVVVGTATNGNKVTSWAAELVSATGATFTTHTERQDSNSGTGNDMSLVVSDHTVTAGTATAAPVFTMTGTGTPTANSPTGASIFLRIRETTTTLATGSDPAAATVAPGVSATDVNLFTLQTNSGTETVSSVTVNLSTSTGVGRLAITDNAGTELGFNTSPATGSNTISVAGMSATTTLANFRVRITPLSHTSMPAVPGASYAITAPVTAWVGGGTHTHTGSDTNTNALTIDNASPANVTAASCAAGDGQVTLNWTNPADADFNSTVALRSSSAVADTPVEGASYSVGNAIGASNVGCAVAAPSATCTDTGLSNGTAYHYRLFTRDNNGNYSGTGVVASGSPCTPASSVSSFNVVETAANAVTGRIHTKIAGQDISVDIVALDSFNAIATGFTGDVAVELVDNSGGGACASLPLIKTLSNQTFTAGNSGRHPLSAGQFDANAYRNVKFRIKYPTASPTMTGCSSDAFANRPLQFVSVLVRDGSRITAGTTNTLSNTSSPGTGVVHNAGRPFRVDTTAQNGAGSPATTTLYTADSGQPVAVLSQCGVASVCPASPGTVTTTGNYSASNGVITNTTASYNDVGSFNLALEDRTFSAVDAGDGTSTAVRYIPSNAAVTVGRFVPDYFSLEAGATITPRSDIVACSGSTFTYMSERMTLGFTLKARDSNNNVTPSYTGATLGALVLSNLPSYGFGAIDSTAPTPLTSRLDLSLSGATGSWTAGSASITVPLALSRAASPDGPFTSLKIGIAPSDPDSVTLQTAALNLDADNNSTPERVRMGSDVVVRFGRLKLSNVYGSELLDLPIPVQSQFWSGNAFATNSDDNCTSLASSSIGLSNYQNSLNSGETGLSPATVSLVSGIGSMKLTRPGSGNSGSVDLCVDLGPDPGVGTVCSATSANLPFLQGKWPPGANWDNDPTARATFGVYKSPLIYRRENY